MEKIYQLFSVKNVGIGLVIITGLIFCKVFILMRRNNAVTTKNSIVYGILCAIIIVGGLIMFAEATSLRSKITATVWFIPMSLIWGMAVLLYACLTLTIVVRYMQKKRANVNLSESAEAQ